MNVAQIGLQLYTLRDMLKTPADIARTLKAVRAIGYESVQVSGMGPIPEEELVAICRGEGLIIRGTHEPSQTLLEDPGAVAERLRKLGCRHTAYPFPAGVNFGDPESVAELIRKLTAAGRVLREAGCSLSYHNHAHEFYRVGGKTLLRHIYDEVPADVLEAELDTYWIQAGGGDPVQWCRDLAGRMPWLHLKDYAVSPEGTPFYAEIGRGNLDWNAIIPAAVEGGCGWFLVEQDVCPEDPLVCVRRSFEYLKETFCR